MSFSYPHILVNGATPDADQVMANFNKIKDYFDTDKIVEADMADKYYRQVLTFTAAAPGAATFDFGAVRLPPVSQYAIAEYISLGVEAIASGGVTAKVILLPGGSSIGGTTVSTVVPPVLIAGTNLDPTALASGSSFKVEITGAFTGVTNLTVCVFLKQIIKGA